MQQRHWYHRAVSVLAALFVTAAGGLAASAPASAADLPEKFTISGSGYGHGVGMSQYGAYELARQGFGGIKILQHYYTGAKAPYTTTPKRIRVQVYGPDPYSFSGYGDSGRTTWVTVSGGDWRVNKPGKGTVAQGSSKVTMKVRIGDRGPVRVKVNGKVYKGDMMRIQWSGTNHWRPNGKEAVATIDGAHGAYRHGRLTIVNRDMTPNITNDLLLNTEYLYGIAEMPSSWGLNGGSRALRAQAMTARSYAIAKHDGKPDCRCHIVDDVRDQHFTGWKKENEGSGGRYGAVWTKAVDQTTQGKTRARVLQVGGRPVTAHYFSSSGGRTANSEDVWSSRLSYERSVDDPYSLRAPGNSYASWTRTMTQQQARDLFGLGNVASIKVTRTWSSGQVRTLTATQPNGRTATLSGKADQMRAWVGRATTQGSMPASWITRIRAE
ncbi:SpoIID/LytB domain protein [Isoptericola sp. CG 20/1183]|uniref:SpoIID/LytB domain protein n=1 Tax=Isoptericola halotolerans TaxID=300560 RepID=A0ABX5EDQ7_9MICO|nr:MULTISPECIES: SpoIID/LytB domain-containing protein [Isoptericola]PRZ06539.1 SpoIID/LytB domain protein [Isoptericola halotolerans]PRZ06655.1 SpoIID/LytB domain protein [Isoptericola sp. CG 20/1183]